ETHERFPKRINSEFIEVISRNEINMRVYERGSGETMACGTGATASAFAGVVSGRLDRDVLVHLRGGDLRIHVEDEDTCFMTGPAVEVFNGEIEV
ncbi:MAG: diaminopimelate epimerase, partial [Synergistaceae bacterium]|nr:diaminopimelate epimerase [Synergistaceae bacterium]